MKRDMEINERKYTSEEADALCGYKPGTLEKKRQRGTGPAYLKNGRTVRYCESQLRAWFERNTRITSESAAVAN